MIDLIGKTVIHNKFGEGHIVRQSKTANGMTIFINFEKTAKEEVGFVFPDAFIGEPKWLSTNDEELLSIIHKISLFDGVDKTKFFDFVEINNDNSWVEETISGTVLRRFNDIKAKKVLIPSNIRVISRKCFTRAKELEEVVFQDGISSIGEGAFEDL